MPNIKSKDLMEKLIYNSQLILNNEDKYLNNMMPRKKADDTFTPEELYTIMVYFTEYLRYSFIKTSIKTLQEFQLIDNDLDVLDDEITRLIIHDSVGSACEEIKNSPKQDKIKVGLIESDGTILFKYKEEIDIGHYPSIDE